MTRSLDGKVVVVLPRRRRRKASRSTTPASRSSEIQAAVEQGVAEGKNGGAAQGREEGAAGRFVSRRHGRRRREGVKLHVAVMEKDK